MGRRELPENLENKLRAEALARGLKGPRADAYVYSTMQRTTTWHPGAKGPFHGRDANGKPTKAIAE